MEPRSRIQGKARLHSSTSESSPSSLNGAPKQDSGKEHGDRWKPVRQLRLNGAPKQDSGKAGVIGYYAGHMFMSQWSPETGFGERDTKSEAGQMGAALSQWSPETGFGERVTNVMAAWTCYKSQWSPETGFGESIRLDAQACAVGTVSMEPRNRIRGKYGYPCSRAYAIPGVSQWSPETGFGES